MLGPVSTETPKLLPPGEVSYYASLVFCGQFFWSVIESGINTLIIKEHSAKIAIFPCLIKDGLDCNTATILPCQPCLHCIGTGQVTEGARSYSSL